MTPMCNICGKSLYTCDHIPGREYNGELCVYPEASIATAPMNEDEVSAWEYRVKNQHWGGLNVTMGRMLATIRDRDRQIAELTREKNEALRMLDESQAELADSVEQTGGLLLDLQRAAPVPTHDTRRAEAFALFRDYLKDARADTNRFEEYAEIAVRNAMALDSAWEKQHG